MVKFQGRHRFVAAVYVLLRDGNKVLLLRRANTDYRNGEYSLPSGHIDGNEPAIQAAARETKEEVGVSVDTEDLHLVHTMHRKSADPEPHERIDLYFETLKWSGEPVIAEPDKCDDLKWVASGELPQNVVPEVADVFRQIAANKPYSDFNFDS